MACDRGEELERFAYRFGIIAPGSGGATTVQEPLVCIQRSLPDRFEVYMNVLFAPTNASLKVNPKVAVMFVPEGDMLDVRKLAGPSSG